MSVNLVHPQYTVYQADWMVLRDCYGGEDVVKSRGIKYLPPTQGMLLDGMNNSKELGYLTYEAYKLRAVWHDLFKEAVEAYIGLLHSKPPQITVPEAMKDVRSNHGETLEQLLRRINEEQLVTGRLGLLVDLPVVANASNPLPYIAMYTAEAVRNWDIGENENLQTKLKYVILDESGHINDPNNLFGWTIETKYRVCILDNEQYKTGLFKVVTGTPIFDMNLMTTPMIRGQALKEIPFTFVNSKDLLSSPDRGPLLGLAKSMLGIYRGEADYRQNLFMQGQDTLVTIGGVIRRDVATNPDAPLRTGAGSRIDMEAGGDAKYIGVNSSGLPEQRSALSNDRQRAEVRAGQLINARVGDKESGEALKTRLAAQTATLKQIALTGGAALETQLKFIATWMGLDPNQVKVEPNEEFSSTLVTGQDAFQLMQAKDLGLPISYESIHAYMVDRGITKKNFEEEFKTIVSEREKIKLLTNPPPQPSNPQPQA